LLSEYVDIHSHVRVVEIFLMQHQEEAAETGELILRSSRGALEYREWWIAFSGCMTSWQWIGQFRRLGFPGPLSHDWSHVYLGSLLYRFLSLAGSMALPLQNLPGL
jgi:hypothetical protein